MIHESELTEEEKQEDEGNFEYVIDDAPSYLCFANNHIEVDGIESLLRSDNIPLMRRWRMGGDVEMIYMAVNFSGADLYVPSKLLERAKMLLSDNGIADNADEAEDSETFAYFLEFSQKWATKRRNMARLALVWSSGVPLVIVALLLNILDRIFSA